jgi:hypothetical protein
MSKIKLLPSQDGLNARVMSVANDGSEVFVGTIAKVCGLWRNAEFTDGEGRLMATGMGEIHYAVHSLTGICPAIVLELHPGYFAMYAGEDMPVARALACEGGYAYRCFAVHESVLMRSLEDAITHAFWKLV